MDAAGQHRDVCPSPQPVDPARAPPHGKADSDQRSAYDSTLAPPAPDYEFDQMPKSTGMLNPGEESVEQWRWISYPSM
jgi:hypothetical protein